MRFLAFFVVIFKERNIEEIKKKKKERIMWFAVCRIEKEKKRKQTGWQFSNRNGWLTREQRKKERKKGTMSDVFVGIFKILKKERNESKKKKRKIEEYEWFVVSQRRSRLQKKVKQGEVSTEWFWLLWKLFFQSCFNCYVSEEKKYFPNWWVFRWERNWIFFNFFFTKTSWIHFLSMKISFFGVFLCHFFQVSYWHLFIL